MKYYHSDFSKSDTEYLYQQIEDLKKYLSQDALFLMEEEPSDQGLVRVVLKVKENEQLFLVDSSADNLLQAAWAAKELMITLVVNRRSKNLPRTKKPEIRVIYN